MSLDQAFYHMLEDKLVTLKEPPQKPNTSSPCYKHNERCAYYSNSRGHDTNHCWALKNKIQDLIEMKEFWNLHKIVNSSFSIISKKHTI